MKTNIPTGSNLGARSPLTAISTEVEQILGPAQSVTDVLDKLDRQYKTDDKQSIFFLNRDQPISPHLAALLVPNSDALTTMGVSEFRNGRNADAIVMFDEVLRLQHESQVSATSILVTRTNRASAIRDLGDAEQARAELRLILLEFDKDPAAPAKSRGRAYYHLAVCEWRLGDLVSATKAAEESRKVYGDESGLATMRRQTEQLIEDLKNNKPPLLPTNVDSQRELELARTRYQARANLATLSLRESALPLLEQILGPAKSTMEVLETLDQQYRKEGKPAIWFLPLNEPIPPHLIELLGPISQKENELFDDTISA